MCLFVCVFVCVSVCVCVCVSVHGTSVFLCTVVFLPLCSLGSVMGLYHRENVEQRSGRMFEISMTLTAGMWVCAPNPRCCVHANKTLCLRLGKDHHLVKVIVQHLGKYATCFLGESQMKIDIALVCVFVWKI